MSLPSSSADLTAGLLDDARAVTGDVADLRHRLHQEPEIGLTLPRTQEKVLEALDGLGYEITTGTETTSVTAVLRGTGSPSSTTSTDGTDEADAARPVVLLRGDMDALPVQEKTGMPFTSRIDGAMHACGHDLHTAMLAGAARVLAGRRDQLAGDVVLMFQPGEEGFDGAGVMLKEGVLDAAGRRADAAFGLHVMSSMADGGTLMSRAGSTMSASDGLMVTVHGAGGHGSAPFAAKDPVTVAAEMVMALQSMVTRQFDVFDPVVVTVGVLQAGTRRNVIPETARLEATIRSFSAAAKARLKASVPQLLEAVAAGHGLTATVEYIEEYPLTVTDETESRFARTVVGELFGPDRHQDMAHPQAGSEDFSRVLAEVPGAFLFLSAVPAGADHTTAAYNHSPYALFDDAVLADGVALYSRLAIDRLASLA
ncbi:M20 family metallopeptidase [Tersicoccus sp. Bi-70]|uniref:M20 metallopeptidase family protein n=1 Tax=Tersicoccus sp. Bi-70 TaxID=1897634 RepID=UPI000977364C|nr:M20 family metallopeptidase [Tersicoccus sp. Bi-70]OMH34094.1 amidohydrolase [Tersicoccus sp. Bi-70]